LETRKRWRQAENLIAAISPRVVLLDCSARSDLKYTALKLLIQAETQFRERGVELWLAALNPEALALVQRTTLGARLGRERMFFTVEQAVAKFEGPAVMRTNVRLPQR
jgi:anti-anti-sigma regulatory factor